MDSRRGVRERSCEPTCAGSDVLGRDAVAEVDDPGVGSDARDDAVNDADVLVAGAVVGEEGDRCGHAPWWCDAVTAPVRRRVRPPRRSDHRRWRGWLEKASRQETFSSHPHECANSTGRSCADPGGWRANTIGPPPYWPPFACPASAISAASNPSGVCTEASRSGSTPCSRNEAL